jgi:hypothetical protein
VVRGSQRIVTRAPDLKVGRRVAVLQARVVDSRGWSTDP